MAVNSNIYAYEELHLAVRPKKSGRNSLRAVICIPYISNRTLRSPADIKIIFNIGLTQVHTKSALQYLSWNLKASDDGV
jgi:hypothetical protein